MDDRQAFDVPIYGERTRVHFRKDLWRRMIAARNDRAGGLVLVETSSSW
ncbi:hypothetical protein [Cohnella rhizosphaerae]|uniref:Uncharacterized protein n=1 Tax=Cohnella rhizosphaerae TaxID=1457232 RepID=A0A9X4QV10_9BACL|nr:hypothetical protein [Cohnella rhizosphaerae]MDG0812099.1 hypothetical protein [Cohnella rhizosphaerae]